MVQDYSDIVLTDHAQEKDLPEFEIENILEKGQGQLFHDRKHDSWARVKKKTVVIYDVEEDKAVVITAYRNNNPTKFSSNRFKEVRTMEV